MVHHGALHTGLTVKRSDIPRGHRPASADLADSKYIEVGWGDDDGYRQPLTSGIAAKALLTIGWTPPTVRAGRFAQALKKTQTKIRHGDVSPIDSL